VQTQAISLPPNGFIRARRLLELIPFSRATLWRHVKAGTFPAPLRLSEGVTAFKNADVLAWMQSRQTPAPTTGSKPRPGRKGANTHEKAA